MEKDVICATRVQTKNRKPIPKKKIEDFVLPDPRCEKCYYWRKITGLDQEMSCCHCALDTGKLRIKLSKTECGSFIDKATAPERKFAFGDVPMTQWGCGGLGLKSKKQV